MSKYTHNIDAALSTDKPIARDDVLRWIAAADDIETLAKLYRLTGERYYSIEPELGRDETCALVLRYLLECIRLDVGGRDDIQERWEAAQTLHGWFCHLDEAGDNSTVLQKASEGVTAAYLSGDDKIRGAIECGFLEHALETTSLRPYFDDWRNDECLRPAWERAMAWGKAHPDFTWGMLKKLRGLQS